MFGSLVMACNLHPLLKTINLNVMKKLKFKLGSLLLTFGICCISYISNAQNVKLSKEEKKEAKRAVAIANYQVLDTLLERKNFVLEADYLQNQYGNRIMVTPLLNFVRVDSTKVVLQTGTNMSLGSNGVGGVTAEGNMDRWRLVKDFKNLSYFLQFSVVTNIGTYDVSMTVNSDNNAQATITGLSRGQLIYDGHLETIANSIIYKGQKSY